jgi:hypothetical protein
MIKIKFFSSFCTSDACIDVYKRLCQTDLDNDYGTKYIFTNNNDFTHAIIMNTAMPALNISKDNVIGLAFEPIEYLGLTNIFVEYAKKYIGKYFVGTKYNLPEPFIEHFSFMWHGTPLLKPINNKNRVMSIIFSKKRDAIGHKYRYELIEKILKTDLPVDIYGYGCELLNTDDSRIKGKFEEKEPYLYYKYHICVENYRHNCYISEKFMNCLIYNCIPIYYGAYKVDEYFPNSCFKLVGNIEIDMKLISAIHNDKMNHINKNIIYPPNMKLTEYIKETFKVT